MKISKADAAAYIRSTHEMSFDKAMEVATVYDCDVFRAGWPVERKYEKYGEGNRRAKVTSVYPFVTIKNNEPILTMPDRSEKPYISTDEDKAASDWHHYTVEIVDVTEED